MPKPFRMKSAIGMRGQRSFTHRLRSYPISEWFPNGEWWTVYIPTNPPRQERGFLLPVWTCDKDHSQEWLGSSLGSLIAEIVCASEGDLCYPLHNAARPMTDPKNNEDQELNLDQLKDAAGGAAFIKIGDIKGEATDKKHSDWIIIESVEQSLGKGSQVKKKQQEYWFL